MIQVSYSSALQQISAAENSSANEPRQFSEVREASRCNSADETDRYDEGHRARYRKQIVRGILHPYGTALLLVTVSFLVTFSLRGFFPYPFLYLFFAAVMGSAWLGGTGAGLFAVLLSTVLVDYYFLPPFHSLAVNAENSMFFFGFVGCALAASWVSASKRRSEEALRDARDELGIRVAERTAEPQASNAELSQRERQLRLLTEVIPQQIWSGTPDGAIDYCNQRLLDYVGYSLDQVHGGRFREIIHPDDRDDFQSAWERTLATGGFFEGQWRVRSADGRYGLFFMRAVPLRHSEGKPLRWYGTNTDIEDRNNAEQALARAHAEVAHLARVLTMGELTASIAHEITRPEVPSCLVLDVQLPGLTGIEFQEVLANSGVRIPIIFVTAHGDVRMTSRAMKAGAIEFLTKPFEKDEFLAAVRQALDRDRARRKEQEEMSVLGSRYERLTSRERDVMALVIEGLLNKQIAGQLGITEITVKIHRGRVMQKMEADSLPELVRMFERLKAHSQL